VRAISRLYEDPDSIERRPWLLQPVRRSHSAAPTGGRCESAQGSMAGSLAGSVASLHGSVGQGGAPHRSAASASAPASASHCRTPRSDAGGSLYGTPRTPQPVLGAGEQRFSAFASRVGAPPAAPRVPRRPASEASQRGVSPGTHTPRRPPGAPYAAPVHRRAQRPLGSRSSVADSTRTAGGPSSSCSSSSFYCRSVSGSTCSFQQPRPSSVGAGSRGKGRASDALLSDMFRSSSATPRRSSAPTSPSKSSPEATASDQKRRSAPSTEEAEAEDAKRSKQARIRSWLLRKEAELAARRRMEEEEAWLLQEQRELQERRREEHEAELQRQRLGRLQAAARRRKELDLELDLLPTSALSEPKSKEGLQAYIPPETIAAYAAPRVTSARGSRGTSGTPSSGRRPRRPPCRASSVQR
ncbi:unnamed protein product, partial [Polarella glacialis]